MMSKGILWHLLIIILFCATMYSFATEILHEKDAPNMGIGIYPLAEQTWKSQVMTCPGYAKNDRAWVVPDFFESEYGESCVFEKDMLKEYGYSLGE